MSQFWLSIAVVLANAWGGLFGGGVIWTYFFSNYDGVIDYDEDGKPMYRIPGDW